MEQQSRRLGYLVAAICFILALRGLSSPATSRQGNRFGMVGMTIAILVSLLLLPHPSVGAYLMILVGDRDRRRDRLRRGAADRDDGDAAARGGVPLAGGPGRRVRRGGCLPLAGDFGITGADGHIHHLSRFEMGLGIVIGAITFSGSVIAFGKLQAKLPPGVESALGPLMGIIRPAMSSRPIMLPGRHVINAAIGGAHRPAPDLVHRRPSTASAFTADDAAGLRDRLPADHPDRRRRHAGRGLDAELLFGLGRGRHRLHAQEPDADRHRCPGRQLGCDPVLHHVQGDEPLVHLA